MARLSFIVGWFARFTAVLLVVAQTVLAEDKDLGSPALRLNLEQSIRSLGDLEAVRSSVPLASIGNQPTRLGRRTKKDQLDASPLFDDFLSVVRNSGIPLRIISDKTGERTIGVSASFNIGEHLPAVAFRAGQSLPEAFGAFSAARSMSWALTWPVHRFTLRFEGGSRTDFGCFAIAGMQWQSATRPMAVGIGIPLKPRNANGPVGVLIQFRLKW